MPESLRMLGEWFAAQVETRERTQDEVSEIENRSRFPIPISNKELTNRTFSLAIDVGMYLSLVFLKTDQTIRWEQSWGGKSSIDYGQPVLLGFGPVPFNLVQILVTLAYGLARKDKTGHRLREIFDHWSKKVQEIKEGK